MPYKLHKRITDPERLREVIRKELEPWIKEHRKSKGPEYQNRILDLLVTKQLAEREPNSILWTKPDIIDIKARDETEKSYKELLEAAKREKKDWLMKRVKEQLKTLDRDFTRTTWICYEKPVWCSIGFCRNKSKIVLNDDFHFNPKNVHSKYCSIHAKFFHRVHVLGFLPGRNKRERLKMQLRKAEFDKKLRDLGLNV
jgi:hypothetical protein